MLHRTRVWTISPTESVEALAEQLTHHTWCCCNGFRLGKYLFVNDSTSADRAQEYAVLKPCGDKYEQIESVTFSWTSYEQALAFIRQVLAGQFDDSPFDTVDRCRLQTPAEHGLCGHCA